MFNCKHCDEKKFEIYNANGFIAFRCKICKAIFSYEENKINILDQGIKKNKNEGKSTQTKDHSNMFKKHFIHGYKGGLDPDPLEE